MQYHGNPLSHIPPGYDLYDPQVVAVDALSIS